MVGYDNLQNWFRTNFALMHHHKYNLSDIEGMMPWERIVYLDLLREHIQQEELRAKEREAIQRVHSVRRPF